MEHNASGVAIHYRSTAAQATRVSALLCDFDANHVNFRLWAKDASLFSGTNEGAFLDWLTEPEYLARALTSLYAISDHIKSRGFSAVVLLGMGGSSLSPLMFKRVFGSSFPFHVVDTIHPSAIARLHREINLTKTLFIIASKSGTTLEPLLLYRYFLHQLTEAKAHDPFAHFMAITDPITPLEQEASESGFLHGPFGKPGIGGRFSGLSVFGIMPAVLMGVDVERLLLSAVTMAQESGPTISAHDNPSAKLAAFFATCLEDGRDRIMFHLSPTLESFGLWLEQLIAESLGKNGRGLVPIIASSDAHFDDTMQVYIGYGEETASLQAKADHLSSDMPQVVFSINDRHHVGGLMYLFQMAVALVATRLAINPFDQPNVERSKHLTKEVLKQLAQGEAILPSSPTKTLEHVDLYDDLSSFARACAPSDYGAILAYLDDTEENLSSLRNLREILQEKLRIPVMLELGPRYLHSTGQLFKGGPNTGHFLVLTGPYPHDMQSREQGLMFSDLHLGQALGDIHAMKESNRHVVHAHLSDVVTGVHNLCKEINSL